MAALAGRTVISLACGLYTHKLPQPERAEVVVVDRFLLCRVRLGIGADITLAGFVGLWAMVTSRILAWFPAMAVSLVVVEVITVMSAMVIISDSVW